MYNYAFPIEATSFPPRKLGQILLCLSKLMKGIYWLDELHKCIANARQWIQHIAQYIYSNVYNLKDHQM